MYWRSAAEAVAKIEKSIESNWVTGLRIPKLELTQGRASGSPRDSAGLQGVLAKPLSHLFWDRSL